MASSQEDLVTVVAADAACQTHFGSNPMRFYPDVMPQNPTYPAAVYQQIGGAPVNSFDGIDALDNPLIQIDVYGATKKAAEDAAKAMQDAIDAAANLGSILESKRSGYEDGLDPRPYRVSMDWSLWHISS